MGVWLKADFFALLGIDEHVGKGLSEVLPTLYNNYTLSSISKVNKSILR